MLSEEHMMSHAQDDLDLDSSPPLKKKRNPFFNLRLTSGDEEEEGSSGDDIAPSAPLTHVAVAPSAPLTNVAEPVPLPDGSSLDVSSAKSSDAPPEGPKTVHTVFDYKWNRCKRFFRRLQQGSGPLQ